MAGVRAVVDSPELLPPVHGLLSLVDPQNAAGDERWGNGILFDSAACGGDVAVYDICAPAGRADSTGGGVIDVEAFIISAPMKCSAMGANPLDLKARAKRKLLACQSKAVEKELWSGALMTNNPRLAHPDASDFGGPLDPTDALAVLEQVLADCGCGSRGVIHATVKTASLLTSKGLIEAKDEPGFRRPVLQTKLGTIVVSGSGYPGTSPSGAGGGTGTTNYMYGTGSVKVLLGEPVVYPEDLSMAVDRATNTIIFNAERPAIAFFNPCCHVAVSVTVPATPAAT